MRRRVVSSAPGAHGLARGFANAGIDPLVAMCDPRGEGGGEVRSTGCRRFEGSWEGWERWC
jgi:hypothetical protein